MECNLKTEKQETSCVRCDPLNMATQWFLSSGLLVEINNGFEVNIARSAAKSGRSERWTSVQTCTTSAMNRRLRRFAGGD